MFLKKQLLLNQRNKLFNRRESISCTFHTIFLLLKCCVKATPFDSIEKRCCNLLLFTCLGKTPHGTSSLIHKTSQFCLYFTPFFFLDIRWKIFDSLAGFCKNCSLPLIISTSLSTALYIQ